MPKRHAMRRKKRKVRKRKVKTRKVKNNGDVTILKNGFALTVMNNLEKKLPYYSLLLVLAYAFPCVWLPIRYTKDILNTYPLSIPYCEWHRVVNESTVKKLLKRLTVSDLHLLIAKQSSQPFTHHRRALREIIKERNMYTVYTLVDGRSLPKFANNEIVFLKIKTTVLRKKNILEYYDEQMEKQCFQRAVVYMGENIFIPIATVDPNEEYRSRNRNHRLLSYRHTDCSHDNASHIIRLLRGSLIRH